MSVILAIDLGPQHSGWCLYDPSAHRVLECGVADNSELAYGINDMAADWLAIERVASYGMAVGRDVFETCEWVGDFRRAWTGPPALLIYRRDVKLHLCNSAKAKDANIRQALLDMFPRTGGGKTPQVGTKAKPGPLFGVSSHAWSALAAAITAHHQITSKEAA
ncbi:MAG TPA: hypothetical protein VL027_01995 [Spongiibacteraceae bacterium]|nr:hypothetical protein [Spongiibacteraceae bacterium]